MHICVSVGVYAEEHSVGVCMLCAVYVAHIYVVYMRHIYICATYIYAPHIYMRHIYTQHIYAPHIYMRHIYSHVYISIHFIIPMFICTLYVCIYMCVCECVWRSTASRCVCCVPHSVCVHICVCVSEYGGVPRRRAYVVRHVWTSLTLSMWHIRRRRAIKYVLMPLSVCVCLWECMYRIYIPLPATRANFCNSLQHTATHCNTHTTNTDVK